ncbi:MAG: hypothetical protein ACFCD0_13990 [Gemmataceae bacterium]
MTLPIWLVGFLFPLVCVPVNAQSYRLQETNEPGNMYRVNARVSLNGTMTVPSKNEEKPAKTLQLSGKSSLDYDERILKLDKSGQVARTARQYRQLELQRKVDDQAQSSSLRNNVRRVVILRHKNMEVPFSPDGPLTWAEIDLVRTDVFPPALSGLLPDKAVAPRDRWTPTSKSIQELTDFEQIKNGTIVCQFQQVTTLGQSRQAQISFSGTVSGIGQDGLTKQQLDGHFYFDLQTNHISYLTMQGTQTFPDEKGNTLGKIEGTFVFTRQQIRSSPTLSNEALQKVTTEPNERNTLLLHQDPDLGIQFLYPRQWRVGGARGNQISIDERNGSGLLLTVEPPKRVPTGAQFARESRDYLEKQKARITSTTAIRLVRQSPRIEDFAIDVAFGKDRFRMYYLVFRNDLGGVVVAARLQLKDLQNLQKDVIGIAATIRLTKKQK